MANGENQQIVPAGEPPNKLAKREKPKNLDELVSALKPAIMRCLPTHLKPERMARVALTAIRTTPHLAECTQASFGSALLGAALIGLEVNTPLQQAWLVPYKNNKKNGIYECQLLIGYQGQLELSGRSGRTHPIRAEAVFQGDEFSYELGLTPRIHHKPNMSVDRDNYQLLTHVYAICKLKDTTADPIIRVLTKQQVEKRRARGANGPAWKTDPIPMALKTAVRAIWPWVPKSPEIALAQAIEDRAERGQTASYAVSQVIDIDTVTELETTGIDLTSGVEEEEEQDQEAQEEKQDISAERSEKVQSALDKARANQAKSKAGAAGQQSMLDGTNDETK